MSSIKAAFKPENCSVYVLSGTSILEAAGRAGIVITFPCGGQGTCGKCRVQIVEGNIPPTSIEEKTLSKDDISNGIRLACQSKITSNCIIDIPPASRESAQQILTKGIQSKKEIKPSVWKKYVELKKPTLDNPKANLNLIREAVKTDFHADIYVIRNLSAILNEAKYKVTCVFSDGELISVEKGDTTKIDYGVAFDIGTTTLVGTLLDLNTGEELALVSRTNPQVIYGDDIISRINFTITDKDGLDKLFYKISRELNDMISELSNKSGISIHNIYKVAIAGNSTMQHICLRVTPKSLAKIPFNLVVRDPVEIKAKKIGIDINPGALVYVLPSIAGFVGGDTVACILATQLHKEKNLKLIIDIGTNGEIVLGNNKKIIAASTAAGPSFEGARISQGMRATIGAIEKVIIDEDVEYNVIGNTAPFGICGTGLIDGVAELLKAGVIDETGRIVSQSEYKGNENIRRRIIETEKGNDFLLIDGHAARSKRPIFISQKDVRELQLAKAAIAAGIKVLQKELNVTDKDISEVYLAGAFGNFIRRTNAKRIGLIPNIPSEKIAFVGNASSSGAKLVLLSYDMEKEAEHVSTQTNYIELSARSDFNENFMNEMMFTGE
ncbi:DUF4445 domain-containing protein [bacterium]|nr:DUF4445 domain-containing protein [bacterium]